MVVYSRLNLNEYVTFHIESDESNVMSLYVFWHRSLCHISQERMKKLMTDGILYSLPDNSRSWVSCVKGKLTKTKGMD